MQCSGSKKDIRISFDFDDTLQFLDVQDVAQDLITKDYDVHILTTRYSDPTCYSFRMSHRDLYSVAEKIGIPKDKIHFTEFEWKTKFVDSLKIDIHIDDNYRNEIVTINNRNLALAIHYLFGSANWKLNLYSVLESMTRMSKRDAINSYKESM